VIVAVEGMGIPLSDEVTLVIAAILAGTCGRGGGKSMPVKLSRRMPPNPWTTLM
jgi:hypothetical protein